MICVDGTLMNTGERSAPVLLKADTHTRTTRHNIVLCCRDWKIALEAYNDKSTAGLKITITCKITDIATT